MMYVMKAPWLSEGRKEGKRMVSNTRDATGTGSSEGGRRKRRTDLIL